MNVTVCEVGHLENCPRISENRLKTIKMEDFQCLSKLNLLSLSNNLIAYIAPNTFHKLASLATLRLSSNALRNLKSNVFGDGCGIKYLHISNNRLQEIDSSSFCSLGKLQLLVLSGNHITNLTRGSISCLKTLSTLYLRKNDIEDIEARAFCGATNLQALILSQNLIKEIAPSAFCDMPSLSLLNLSHNAIQDIENNSFCETMSLTALDLTGNLLTKITNKTFACLGKLFKLQLSYNNMQDIAPRSFCTLLKLKRLYLDQNKLQNISESMLSCLKKLLTLNLNLNEINNIMVGAFEDLVILQELRLVDNLIFDLSLFYNLTSIQLLSLESNQISTISPVAFTKLAKLATLKLAGNHLSRFNGLIFSANVTLSVLGLEKTNIRRLSGPDIFNGNQTLAELKITHNYLQESPPLNFNGVPSLESLFLRNNRLNSVHDLTMANLKSLRKLDLRGNHLKDLTFLQPLISLSFLYLDNNRIRSVKSTFDGISSLTNLSLEGNHIDSWNALRFNNTKLISLIFDNNNISHIESNCQLIFERLSHINIAGNNVKKLSTDIDPYFFRSLDISDNPIRLQNIKGILRRRTVIYITALDISNNNLGSIDIANLAADSYKNLEALYVQGNSLAFVTQTSFFGPPDLSTVLSGRDYLCCMVPGKVKTCQPTNLIYSDGDFGLHSENWLSNPGCHIACLLVIISTLMSVLIMAIISVDRFICIAYPFSTANLSLKVARITLGLEVIASFNAIED
ncbi:uncharacterized protein TRIADDRAFT_60575 [Trichoplax adhaerens]|uniref:Uncharacterized protein n=1 Tax=Trichoplax adhaerens TaxID=10228 RepID=B3S8K9_TRIAD|nr:hypothetical protein TRIADDRAFT_60575 [Trichoplax adhaerens]EDV20972.1 hypothetical protein TRIADDRAFT_60575 [Trichoplax adhaerens]|eukprot:XP_002116616.1 hypothetical protein TRIADDRAFT_60575 [Trichoplax adhaerens]